MTFTIKNLNIQNQMAKMNINIREKKKKRCVIQTQRQLLSPQILINVYETITTQFLIKLTITVSASEVS